MDRFTKLFKYKILPIYWAFLTYILLKPSDIEDSELYFSFSGMDKMIHVVAFGVLGLLYCISFPRQNKSVSVVIMLGYAIASEVLQEIMKLGRTMEAMDVVADSVGVFLGVFLWEKIKAKI